MGGSEQQMKVLYIGHYREGTGWSQAAIDYILAMDSVGIDVACRNVNLTGSQPDLPERILELEQKSSKDCSICLQHLLPHHLVGTQRFEKNIAYFVSESTSIQVTPWFVQLQQMDEVWVPNQSLQEGLATDNLMHKDRIKLVPHTFDLKKYKQQYSPISIDSVNPKFKFYYIGDINDRKNLDVIVRSFHSEFDKSEPVALILKVRKFGLSPQQVHAGITELCNKVKHRMRLYSSIEDYHQEVIIPDDMSSDGINSLHQYGDCFVSPSHGEGWSIPSFESMCYGNTPICSDNGGPTDFIDDNNKSTGVCVGGTYGICDCGDAAFPEIFTGREEWFIPSELQIKKWMRHYYENRGRIDRDAGLKRGEEFSYTKIGNLIKEYLEEQHV